MKLATSLPAILNIKTALLRFLVGYFEGEMRFFTACGFHESRARCFARKLRKTVKMWAIVWSTILNGVFYDGASSKRIRIGCGSRSTYCHTLFICNRRYSYLYKHFFPHIQGIVKSPHLNSGDRFAEYLTTYLPTRSNNEIFRRKHAVTVVDLLHGFYRFRCAISSGNISDFLGEETRRESLRSARWQVYGRVGIPRFSRTPRNDFLCYKYQYRVEIAEGVNTNERYILPYTCTYTHANTERKQAMCGYWKSSRVIRHGVYAVDGLWRLHALVGPVNGILNLIEEAVRDLSHDGNNYRLRKDILLIRFCFLEHFSCN